MGYPAVLIHGAWCTGRNWDVVVSHLAIRGYDCHTPTLPAHEPTSSQPLQVGAKSLSEYADFICDYIRQQNFTVPPVIIGHSMGGWIAQAVASRMDVLATVLLTPAPPAGINILRLSNILFLTPHILRWGFWRKAFMFSTASGRRWAANGIDPVRQEKIFAGLVHESGRALCEMGFWWLGFRAARINTAAVKSPVFVVNSGADGLTPTGVVRKVAALYPNAVHRLYPGRSHWVIDDEQTEDMVHEFAGWLQPMVQRASRRKAA